MSNLNLNKVVLCGRLTADPELKQTQNGIAVVSFTIAVNRRFTRGADGQGNSQADFINCVAFGRTGEFMERFGRKGTKFLVEGRIQTGSYTNRDGQKVYTTDVVVEQVEFAESKSTGDNSGYVPADRPSPSGAAGDGFMNIPDGIDEELPFN